MIQERPNQLCVSDVVYTREAEGKTENLSLTHAAYGHGEEVVKNMIPIDTFYVDPSGSIDKNVVHKSDRIAPSGTGELTRKTNTGIYDPNTSALSDEHILALDEICKQIEAHHTKLMDIEWVIENDQIHIVQARDVPDRVTLEHEIPCYLDETDLVPSKTTCILWTLQTL